MNPHQRSRRGFICGPLAGLTSWLCPHPTLPAAPTIALPPAKGDRCVSFSYDSSGQRCTTYEYDGRSRLVRVTDHPPSASTPIFDAFNANGVRSRG